MRPIKLPIAILLFLGTTLMSAQVPEWEVNTANYQGTMTITGVIQIDGFDSRSTDDLVGIFSGTECRGVAKPLYSEALDRYLVFVSVFGNELPETMTFKVYESLRDTIFDGEKAIDYTLNGSLGTIGEPYIFAAGNLPFVFVMEDKDMDGFFTDTDCDDDDPFINPGGFEIAGDQVDQNCNESLEVETPQITYLNDFNQVSNDFNTHGFSIRQEEGFDQPALHSDHPYGKLSVDKPFDLFSILNIPIIVDETNPTIRFKEVVLVEPSDEGATYPGTNFRDYVIVEARKADQVQWTPLLSAYDVNDKAEWKTAYNSNIDPVAGESTAKGNQTLFREQMIDISENFSAGDTIKIRFRLYSDYFDYGWGWAIDDLEIQNPISTSTKSNFEAGLLKAYPNPLTGQQLNVRLDQFEANRPLHITLTDALGNLVFRQTRTSFNTNTEMILNLPKLPAGCYFLAATDGQKRSTQKIMKTQ